MNFNRKVILGAIPWIVRVLLPQFSNQLANDIEAFANEIRHLEQQVAQAEQRAAQAEQRARRAERQRDQLITLLKSM
jgi:cell division septum initiation protein DivIVA